jgi:hypothetical protein
LSLDSNGKGGYTFDMPFYFYIPRLASDKCLSASNVYERGLQLSGQNYRKITVHGYKGSLKYAEVDTAAAIKGRRKYIWHRLTKVGSRYVDWTARQFDSRVPYPLIVGLKELRRLWQHVEDTTIERSYDKQKTKVK